MARNVAGTVADPTIEYVPITLAGKEWNLAYDFNAIANAEHLTGLNLMQGISGFLLGTWTATQFRALLFAALQKAHPKITLEQAGSLLTIDSMPPVRDALLKSFGLSLPEEKKEDPPVAEGTPAES